MELIYIKSTVGGIITPVIGVILMVAIVVILAAVIAAFVFGMTGNVSSTKTVGVTVTAAGPDGTGEVVWQGGADLPKIVNYMFTVGGVPEAVKEVTPTVGQVDLTSSPVIGERVIINATFQDGTGQVIYDKQF